VMADVPIVVAVAGPLNPPILGDFELGKIGLPNDSGPPRIGG
jgi:hypothetical protein